LSYLEYIGPRFVLPDSREATWILIVENVKAAEFVQLDTFIKDRVRLTTENFDMVPEVRQSFGQMARIYTLTSNMWFATVCEVRKAQRAIWVRHRGHGFQAYLSAMFDLLG
jgi:hypothetical protein